MSNRIKVIKPNPADPISYVAEDCMDNLAHINSKLRLDQKWQLELVEWNEETQKEVGLIRVIEKSPTIAGKTEVIKKNEQINALSDENYKLMQEIAELRRIKAVPNDAPVSAPVQTLNEAPKAKAGRPFANKPVPQTETV